MKQKIIAIICLICIMVPNIMSYAVEPAEQVEVIETEQAEAELDGEQPIMVPAEEETTEASINENVDDVLIGGALAEPIAAGVHPQLTYSAHLRNVGWEGTVLEGATAGRTGENRALEALRVEVRSETLSGTIETRAHVRNIGWQSYVSAPQFAGTTGRNLPIEALEMRLTGELAEHYDIYYRLHSANFGWLDWAKNGMMAGTSGWAFHAEAVEIKLVVKGENSGLSTTRPAVQYLAPLVQYKVHGQNYGWQATMTNGAVAGTIGQSRRIEAIQIATTTGMLSGGIEYSAHVQNIGWQNYVGSNTIAGTQGQALRMEAIKIRLTGEISKYFDVYYRGHIQNHGWLAWTFNDGIVGSVGVALRMEALQIRLVRKGSAAPGATGRAYVGSAELTASNRDRVLRIAQSHVSSRVYAQHNMFTTKYPYAHGGWCTLFVQWCFEQAGLGHLFYGGNYEWDPEIVFRYHRQRGEVIYTNPRAGDIALYDWDKNGYMDHADIVVGTSSNAVHVVSGNWGSRVVNVTRAVGDRYYYPTAYIRPQY